MIVSEARLAANRRNAGLSKGPTTPEGKARSRANALKHGLCALVVVPESPELIQQRTLEFFYTLQPDNELGVWMVEQAAIASIRIEHCQRMERGVRDKIMLKANLTWDDDRRLEAEILGQSLAKDPARTVETLRQTLQGCEWLLRRWAMLAYSADTQPGWTDEQSKLAFDLLATPPAFREGRKPGELIDDEGRLIANGNDPAAVARREIAALKEHREVVAELDEADRSLAVSDLTSQDDPELKRLRRYESTLQTRMKWSLKQITTPPPDLIPEPEPKPAEEVTEERELEPEDAPAPARPAHVPASVSPRREKQLLKAAARRESRRKKLDKLHA